MTILILGGTGAMGVHLTRILAGGGVKFMLPHEKKEKARMA